MNFLSHMRIGTRLAVGFAVVLLLAILATSVALVNARANAAATKQMMEKPLAKERIVSDWYVLIYSAIARTALIARSTDETLSVTFADVIAGSTKRGGELLGTIKELLVTDEEKAMFEASVTSRNQYQKAKTDIMNAKKAGNAPEAERVFNDVFTPAATAYQNKVKDLLTLQRKAIDDTAHAIDAANDRSNMLLMILAVLMVSIGSVAAWIISRSITVPLQSAVDIASTVANGDLTTQFKAESNRDEIGDLMTALKGMNDSLRNVVSQVQLGTNTIATASNEIAAGNMDLSQRTEEQARLRELVGLLGVLRVLTHGRCQFLHRRCGFLQRAGLFLGAL
jgi:methyl-accepting chemotaxis protein